MCGPGARLVEGALRVEALGLRHAAAAEVRRPAAARRAHVAREVETRERGGAAERARQLADARRAELGVGQAQGDEVARAAEHRRELEAADVAEAVGREVEARA